MKDQSPETWRTQRTQRLQNAVQRFFPALFLGFIAGEGGGASLDALQGRELDSFILEIAALELKGVTAYE